VYSEYQSKGVEIIGVELENNSPGQAADVNFVAQYARQHNWNFPAAADPIGDLWAYFPQNAVPLNIAINGANMAILESSSGAMTSSGMVKEFLDRNLKKVQN